MAELLALVNITDMYLYDGAAQAADTVLQGHAGVGVGSGIEHDAVVAPEEARLLHLVDELALHVALIVVYLYIRVFLPQLGQIAVERLAAVDARFALSQQVQVWSVDNLDFHFFSSLATLRLQKYEELLNHANK